MFHLFCVDSGKYVDDTIPGVDDVTRLVLVDCPEELLDVWWRMNYDSMVEQFRNWRKTKMTNEIAGEKHYTIIRKPIPVEFECEKCGCVFQLPLKECGKGVVPGPEGTNYAKDGYVAACPECGARCGIWKEDHERNIKAVRKCEVGLVLENKD